MRLHIPRDEKYIRRERKEVVVSGKGANKQRDDDVKGSAAAAANVESKLNAV